MRSASTALFSICAVIVLTAASALAQQQVISIRQLKEDILKFEAIDRDSSYPDEVKIKNREILAKRRAALRDLLVKRIDALRRYQTSVGSSLRDEEKETIDDSIRNLEAELQKLEMTMRSGSALEPSASNVAASNLIASIGPVAATTVKTGFVPTMDSLSLDEAQPGLAATGAATGCTITIASPPNPSYTVFNQTEVPLEIKVTPSNCTKKLRVTVENDFSTIYEDTVDVVRGGATIEGVKIAEGTNTIRVMDDEERSHFSNVQFICQGKGCPKATAAGTTAKTQATADENKPVDRFSSIFTRGIVGFEQAGASSADSETKPFLEFFWDTPIATLSPDAEHTAEQRAVYPVMSIWGYVRLSSTPRQLTTSLATFAPDFLNPITQTGVNDLVKSFNFMVGLEKAVHVPAHVVGTQHLPTGTPGVTQKLSTYLIAGIGAINPLTSRPTARIFAKPTVAADLTRLQDLFGVTVPTSAQYVAFISSDRDVFFRQYYAGIRIKTHYFKEENGVLNVINRPGAMFDLTIGQNEAVTGGHLRSAVARFDGFYPLPVSDKSTFYLFGTAWVNLRRRPNITSPLILATAPSTVTIPNDNVFVIATPQENRDYYRIGLGVNLIELFNKKKSENKPAQGSTP